MCTVVLIHGTWAPKAPWSRAGSPFSAMLETELRARGIQDVKFERLDWSGRNAHTDRRRASIRLRQLIGQLRARDETPIFLVGHSHGGNIALKAARQMRTTNPIAGVVTLATPFLQFSENPPIVARLAATLRRGVPSALKIAAAWVGLGLLALLMSPLVEMRLELRNWIWSSQREPWLFELVVAPLIACGYAFAMFTMAFASGRERADTLDRPREARTRQALRRYFYVQPASELRGVPIFSLSAPVDEAFQALNGAWWAHRVVIWVARLLVGVALLGIAAAAVSSAVAIGYIGMTSAYDPAFVRTGIMLFCAIGAILVPSAFLFAASLASLLRAFAALPAPLLGLEGGQRRLLWSVHARRRLELGPKYRHRSYEFSELLGQGFGLMHSSLYKSPRAVHDVADWMSKVAAHP